MAILRIRDRKILEHWGGPRCQTALVAPAEAAVLAIGCGRALSSVSRSEPLRLPVDRDA